MKEAIIGNRIFLPADNKAHEEAIIATLTYKLVDAFKSRRHGKEIYEIIKTYQRHPHGFYSIPAGRIDLIPEHYKITDNRIVEEVYFPPHNLILRPSQQAVYDEIQGSALINAPVSWGKTYTGIAIASKLKLKTLVITHTTALRDQWIQNCRDIFNREPGVIGAGDYIGMDKPIVIANIQTLKKDIPRISKVFGTVIVDECHHVPAQTFTDVVDNLWAKHRIGLSGTIQRKDGKHVIFHDFFGSKLFQPEAENRVNPIVVIVKTKIKLLPADHWAMMITELCNNENYRNLVSKLADTMAIKGHKVLVVGERVNLLESCAERSGDKACVITGSVSDYNERINIMNGVRDGTYNILYGSRTIFSEGISLNELSCLILACSINNVLNLEQLIGRIQRICTDKKTPVVVDINLNDSVSKRQAAERKLYYLSKGYKIYTLDEK